MQKNCFPSLSLATPAFKSKFFLAARLTVLVWLGLTLSVANSTEIPSLYTYTANKIGVPASLLYAISKTESTYPKSGKVWPWTINVRGKGYYFTSRKKAYKAIQHFLGKGITSIDIGLMQTNWYWQKHRLGTTWQALDPTFNVRVGAQILRSCYDVKKDWWSCVGDYHSPATTPERARRAERYRQRVYNNLPKGQV